MYSGQPQDREREVVAALLEHNHHLIRTGQILLAAEGFAGKGCTQLTDAMGLRLLRPRPPHGGRTPAGVLTRVAQRLLAMAAGIWHNRTTGNPSKRSLTAYDH